MDCRLNYFEKLDKVKGLYQFPPGPYRRQDPPSIEEEDFEDVSEQLRGKVLLNPFYLLSDETVSYYRRGEDVYAAWSVPEFFSDDEDEDDEDDLLSPCGRRYLYVTLRAGEDFGKQLEFPDAGIEELDKYVDLIADITESIRSEFISRRLPTYIPNEEAVYYALERSGAVLAIWEAPQYMIQSIARHGSFPCHRPRPLYWGLDFGSHKVADITTIMRRWVSTLPEHVRCSPEQVRYFLDDELRTYAVWHYLPDDEHSKEGAEEHKPLEGKYNVLKLLPVTYDIPGSQNPTIVDGFPADKCSDVSHVFHRRISSPPHKQVRYFLLPNWDAVAVWPCDS